MKKYSRWSRSRIWAKVTAPGSSQIPRLRLLLRNPGPDQNHPDQLQLCECLEQQGVGGAGGGGRVRSLHQAGGRIPRQVGGHTNKHKLNITGLFSCSFTQCCESGSGWIWNFFLDPEFFVPDSDPGKTVKKSSFNFFFFVLIVQKIQWNDSLKAFS